MSEVCLIDSGSAYDALLSYELHRVLSNLREIPAAEVSNHVLATAFAKYGHLLTEDSDLLIVIVGNGRPLCEYELHGILHTVVPQYERGWAFQFAATFGTVLLATRGLPLDFEHLRVKVMPDDHASTRTGLPSVTTFFLGSSIKYRQRGFRHMGVHQVDPNPAGFFAAHAHLARLSPTDAFCVIDEDSEYVSLPEFPSVIRHNLIYSCRNPYNGLVYGHGGLKVFLRQALRCDPPSDTEDMTLHLSKEVGLEVKGEVCSEHHFAVTEFDGFRAAFREAYKLARTGGEEAQARLEIWCNFPYAPEYRSIGVGARMGRDFAEHSVDYPINRREHIQDVYATWRASFLRRA